MEYFWQIISLFLINIVLICQYCLWENLADLVGISNPVLHYLHPPPPPSPTVARPRGFQGIPPPPKNSTIAVYPPLLLLGRHSINHSIPFNQIKMAVFVFSRGCSTNTSVTDFVKDVWNLDIFDCEPKYACVFFAYILRFHFSFLNHFPHISHSNALNVFYTWRNTYMRL